MSDSTIMQQRNHDRLSFMDNLKERSIINKEPIRLRHKKRNLMSSDPSMNSTDDSVDSSSLIDAAMLLSSSDEATVQTGLSILETYSETIHGFDLLLESLNIYDKLISLFLGQSGNTIAITILTIMVNSHSCSPQTFFPDDFLRRVIQCINIDCHQLQNVSLKLLHNISLDSNTSSDFLCHHGILQALSTFWENVMNLKTIIQNPIENRISYSFGDYHEEIGFSLRLFSYLSSASQAQELAQAHIRTFITFLFSLDYTIAIPAMTCILCVNQHFRGVLKELSIPLNLMEDGSWKNVTLLQFCVLQLPEQQKILQELQVRDQILSLLRRRRRIVERRQLYHKPRLFQTEEIAAVSADQIKFNNTCSFIVGLIKYIGSYASRTLSDTKLVVDEGALPSIGSLLETLIYLEDDCLENYEQEERNLRANVCQGIEVVGWENIHLLFAPGDDFSDVTIEEVNEDSNFLEDCPNQSSLSVISSSIHYEAISQCLFVLSNVASEKSLSERILSTCFHAANPTGTFYSTLLAALEIPFQTIQTEGQYLLYNLSLGELYTVNTILSHNVVSRLLKTRLSVPYSEESDDTLASYASSRGSHSAP
ncbi:hypothetical protein BLNAU_479 [Blattamonas nauphoetae]|uniref:Uncharacterized protein n=1 Tax=Blattamonas nauphoetae TaxID=2049346 RepID=A0ABQ9YLD0_9EUKA|nr:hypothetical protein BLNAU_479 [Blattamonas nauphoetae]